MDKVTENLQWLEKSSRRKHFRKKFFIQGESFVVHPKEISNTISVPVSPPKDILVDLHIKVRHY